METARLRLRELRLKADMTQRELARLTEKTEAEISKLETGQRKLISFDDLALFADVFDCSFDELLERVKKDDSAA